MERLPTIYSAKLLEVLMGLPYCRIGDLVSAGMAKRQAADGYLKQLVKVGIPSDEEVGREKLFTHQEHRQLLLSEDA